MAFEGINITVDGTGRGTVSVLVPVYNTAQYLPECIESVLGQTYGDLELVLYDDGCTDGSSDIMMDYAAKDRRIRIIGDGTNRWLLHARNELIRSCRTEFCAWLDSDDVYEKDFLELAVRAQSWSGCDIVQLWSSVMTERDLSVPKPSQLTRTPPCTLYGRELLGNVLDRFVSTRYLFWSKLFRTAVLKRCTTPFEDRYFVDDHFYTVPILCTAQSYANVDTGKCIHRYRDGNHLNKLASLDAHGYGEMCRCTHDVLAYWLQWLTAHGKYSEEACRTCARNAEIQLCAEKAVKLYRKTGEDLSGVFFSYFCDGDRPLVSNSFEYPQLTHAVSTWLLAGIAAARSLGRK